MEMLMEGLEEIAAEKERSFQERIEKDRQEADKKTVDISVAQKAAPVKLKSQAMSRQEEKLIEDVLKEFFA
jgi:hypothetical protein